MLDVDRLRQDAAYILERGGDHISEFLASELVRILDNPSLVTPTGYSLVKKPELIGLGVPQR